MANRLRILVVLMVLVIQSVAASSSLLSSSKRPNFLVIVADDLGFSDMGAFGGEIQTPNLDKLAKEGTRLTNFYVAPSCSPTRAMLLTGLDNHLVGLGAMAEISNSALKQLPGYEGHLSSKVATVAELLSRNGYHTYMAGKWHLGEGKGQGPHSRGFDESFALIEGAGGHYDRTGYSARYSKVHYRKNGQDLNRLPRDFYSTISYTDNIIENIEGQRSDNKPFFAYLAYTAPHWPLQAPKKVVLKYKDKYRAGFEAIYEKRIQRIQKLNLIPNAKKIDAPNFLKKWADLSEQEQEREARMMEIYAAMVDVMDQQIGRLLTCLRRNGEYENTFIVFLSDNGPESRYPMTSAENTAWIDNNFDNRLQNLGKADSFVYYSPEWARVSGAPFSMFKSYTLEGGIHAPAIVSYPAGNYRKGLVRDIVTVRDIVPTVLALAKVGQDDAYGDNRINKLRGKNLSESLSATVVVARDEKQRYGWELHGRGAMRHGKWKIVWSRKDPRHSNRAPAWELFNLDTDPSEQHNLADTMPEVLAEMISSWHIYTKENGVQPLAKW